MLGLDLPITGTVQQVIVTEPAAPVIGIWSRMPGGTCR